MKPDQQKTNLESWLSDVLTAKVEVVLITPLKGGGIQENWTVEASIDGFSCAYVLRKNAVATIEASHSRRNEFILIKAAHAAGVTVPEPIAFCDNPAVFGGPFALLAKVSGTGLGPKVVKDLRQADRLPLTCQLAKELAKIHSITPFQRGVAEDDLTFLGAAPTDFARVEITLIRDWLDHLKLSRPALEWALRWAELHIPKQRTCTLIHRDFRTGNYMVEDGRLTAVLDWEFACWGDPLFDIGWFHAQCWRFSRPDLEAGGIGERAAFYQAYEAAGGNPVDDEAVRAYEVLAHCRWAVIALQQGDRHTSGREPSLEHALTGKIAEELELMALRLTNPERWQHHFKGHNDVLGRSIR